MNARRLLLSLLVLLLGLTGCQSKTPARQTSEQTPTAGVIASSTVVLAATPTGKDDDMLSVKPLLNVKLDIEHCSYELYINGGLVAQNTGAVPAHEEYPVNHWLRSGRNELQLTMQKWENKVDACQVEVVLTTRDDGADPSTPSRTLFSLVHSAESAARGQPTEGSSFAGTFDAVTGQASDHGSVRVGPAIVSRNPGRFSYEHLLKRQFELPLPFPEWAFFQGDVHKHLYAYEKDFDSFPRYMELIEAYGQLKDLLAAKNLGAFLDACDARSRELDVAYYKPPGSTRKALKEQVESVMDDPKYELVDVRKRDGTKGNGYWNYLVGPTGKLIMLTTGDRGSPVLRYQLKGDEPFAIIIPTMFHTKNGKFIVSR